MRLRTYSSETSVTVVQVVAVIAGWISTLNFTESALLALAFVSIVGLFFYVFSPIKATGWQVAGMNVRFIVFFILGTCTTYGFEGIFQHYEPFLSYPAALFFQFFAVVAGCWKKVLRGSEKVVS